MKNIQVVYAITGSLLAIAAICVFLFVSAYSTAQQEIAEYTEIQDSYTSILTKNDMPDADKALPATSNLPYMLADFDSLIKANPDTAGWLAIPGTEIAYPVLQSSDNDKYLHTSFYGERSGVGALFMDSGNALNPLDQNTIVYGHNMGQGRSDMFSTLLLYQEKTYYDTRQWVQFNTIHGQYGWWRIFAVIHLDIRDDSFDYLKQNFKDAAEFEAWIAQAKALSVYDTNVDISAPDAHILTLSTCNRAEYGRNGRQIILAVNMG